MKVLLVFTDAFYQWVVTFLIQTEAIQIVDKILLQELLSCLGFRLKMGSNNDLVFIATNCQLIAKTLDTD